jgi:hypothetical protein
MQLEQKYWRDFFPQSALCPIHIFEKSIKWYPSTFFTHNLSLLWMFQKAHNMPNDMLHTHNTHIMFKAHITWTQNVFRVQGKNKQGKGQTEQKN